MGDFGLLVSQFNAVLPTLTDGSYSELQIDQNGRLLVQADVSVVIDFLGLNGAADSSNILIVGTEDGTQTGTAHAFRLDASGALAIQDNGGSITVDAVDLDIRDLSAAQDNVAISDGVDTLAINGDGSINSVVTATDLDIRDLDHASDSVSIGDGTDLLAIEADGSINVNATIASEGTEAYNASDDLANAGDGLISITAAATPFVEVVSIAVGVGQVLHVYGMDWTCDQNANAKLISDDGVNEVVYKQSLNSSAQPDVDKYWGKDARIEIAGSATMNVKIQIKKRNTAGGNASGFGSIHARLV